MNNLQTWTVIVSYPVILIFLLSGIYLFVKLRNVKRLQNNWLATLPLSAEAKAVHEQQLLGQTAKFFSKQWFIDYWQGKRSVFYAFFTWIACGNFIFFCLFGLSLWLSVLAIDTHFWVTFIFIFVALAWHVYRLLSGIILWKSAKNSTPFCKYFSRVIAATCILK